MLVKLMIMNTCNSLMILMMNHPLSMGVMILLQTSLIALILGFFNLNFWFSYILFLIMIGGMMILFIYMTSVASNEKFKISMTISFIYLSMILLTLNPLYPSYSMNLNNIYMESMKQMSSYMTLNKFLNKPMSFTLIMIFIYLLITLIAVVKITNIKNGPIRQKS